MKSICIKTNNPGMIQYLLEQLENMGIPDTYLSLKEFHHFQNIIIHCKSYQYITSLIHSLSNILTKAILLFCEQEIIHNAICLNYFYFNGLEKHTIFEQTLQLLNHPDNNTARYDLLNNALFEYLSSHHSFYLQGFLNFRIPLYQAIINENVDIAVNQFIIDKEYADFIHLLRLYIRSESTTSHMEHLHLIYGNHQSTIINDNKEIVSCNENLAKAKYISDISFSSNDLALNTLLNLLPKKITIHLIDSYADEFVHTLQLIFQEKITICEDCDICDFYRFSKIEP